MWSQWVGHCRKHPYDVYIGRPSEWGNPYKIGVDGNRDECCDRYEDAIRGSQNLVSRIKSELKGKRLGCWCGEDERCHGDILAKIANEGLL